MGTSKSAVGETNFLDVNADLAGKRKIPRIESYHAEN
jgi:hypothetical protein